MERPFPIIDDSQVALIIDDIATGHVRNRQLMLINNNEENVYHIFENFELALKEAKNIVSNHHYFECWIYDKNGKIIEHIIPLPR